MCVHVKPEMTPSPSWHDQRRHRHAQAHTKAKGHKREREAQTKARAQKTRTGLLAYTCTLHVTTACQGHINSRGWTAAPCIVEHAHMHMQNPKKERTAHNAQIRLTFTATHIYASAPHPHATGLTQRMNCVRVCVCTCPCMWVGACMSDLRFCRCASMSAIVHEVSREEGTETGAECKSAVYKKSLPLASSFFSVSTCAFRRRVISESQ